MALLIPTIRADFVLLDSYRYRRRAPLGVPVSVLAGRRDELLSERGIASWQDETCAAFSRRWMDGGHFYFQESKDDLMDVLSAVIDPLLISRISGGSPLT